MMILDILWTFRESKDSLVSTTLNARFVFSLLFIESTRKHTINYNNSQHKCKTHKKWNQGQTVRKRIFFHRFIFAIHSISISLRIRNSIIAIEKLRREKNELIQIKINVMKRTVNNCKIVKTGSNRFWWYKRSL